MKTLFNKTNPQAILRGVANSLSLTAALLTPFGLPLPGHAQAVYPTPYTFDTIAGDGSFGTNDGVGTSAHFGGPNNLAVDAAGNIYLADTDNNTIRKITRVGATWVVSTLAGTAGVTGTNDGTNGAAQFHYPSGVAVDSASNIYVADTYNYTIRRVSPVGNNWVVKTLVGQPGSYGTLDGTNNHTLLYQPTGVAVDSASNVYLTDPADSTIRKVSPVGTNWVLTTLIKSSPLFLQPAGIAVDAATNLFVSDQVFGTINEISKVGTNWVPTVLAGRSGILVEGNLDAVGTNAEFYYPAGLAVDSAHNIYVADTYNDVIREVSPSGSNWVVTTLAGLDSQEGGDNGFVDGTGNFARFNYPYGVAVDKSGRVYVADTENSAIRGGSNSCLTINWPTNKTEPCGSKWTFDSPTAASCCTNEAFRTNGLLTNISIISLGAVTNGTCPLVTITQTWLISDACGASNLCTQVVTQECCSTNCITLMCPSDIVLTSCANCAPVYYSAVASNMCCSGNVVLNYNPPSGTCFPIGSNLVQVTAYDPNCVSTPQVTCSFSVIILQGSAQGTNGCINCCTNCAAPYPDSYSVTLYPGSNFLANTLCQGVNNTIADLLTNSGGTFDNMTVYPWIQMNQSFEFADYGNSQASITGWENGGTAILTPGVGFMVINPNTTPVTFTISGCQPTCPLPCAPSNGNNLVGGFGTNILTWSNLYSCPPPCGTAIMIFNPAAQQFATYTFAGNTWTPPLPVPLLATGHSAFVSVTPCPTNCINLTCPSNIVVTSCSNCVPVFYSAQVTDSCCTNLTGTTGVTVTYDPPSGTCFNPGTNSVLVTATDCLNNTNMCTFAVVVLQDTNCCTNMVTNLVLNTGYDPASNNLYNFNNSDAIWWVTKDPTPMTSLPRPATVIAPNPAWQPAQPNSLWISSYPSDSDNVNGEYDFQTYFCTSANATNLVLSICLRADDAAAAALNGHIIPLSPANTTWGAPSPACGVAIAPSWFVVGGQNVLTVFVTNIYAVAMGLNADVSVTGSGLIPLGSPCCQFGSGLSGQKIFDVNCDGVLEPWEPGLSGWTIQLSNGSNTVTDVNGYYYFTNLAPGTYTVTEIPQAGWTQSFPAGGSYTVTLTNLQQLNELNFGNCHPDTNHCLQINCSPDITVPCAGDGGAIVAYNVSATNLCTNTPVRLYCVPASTSFFPVGTTTVHCTAYDSEGDSTNCTFTVTVLPCQTNSNCINLTCPSNIVVTSCSNCVPVFYSAQVTDSCCTNLTGTTGVTVTYDPPSGTCFNPGTNSVLVTATDCLNNTNMCTFAVVVLQDTNCCTNMVTNLVLNTGYDPASNNLYNFNNSDAIWWVTKDPTPMTSLPRPATVIAPNPAWQPAQPNSLWISSYPSDSDNVNGEYDFQTYFCTSANATNLVLSICLRADDAAAAALNGHIIPLSPANTTWGAPSPACGVAIAPSWFVVGGQNVLTVFVTNIYAVAMGLNADVSVTGSGLIPLGSPCCQFGSGLSGQKIFDVNCDGVLEPWEPGLSGWTIQLSNGSNTVTDVNGYYYFTNLAPGTYTVTEIPQAGWTQSFPAGGSYTVTLTNLQQLNELNFGNCHPDTNHCLQINCSPDITVPCAGDGGAIVAYNVSATNLCTNTPVRLYCVPASTSFFPVGTTTVHCTAYDSEGDSTNCIFTVTVLPCQTNSNCIELNCPSNIVVTSCSNCIAVYYEASATDFCCTNPAGGSGLTLTYDPPSGTCFPLGTTNVQVTATDACSNSATCSFPVTVLSHTNQGCCGPGLGAQTIQWLNLPTNGWVSSNSPGLNPLGSWIVTNLPCYGNVLMTQNCPDEIYYFLNTLTVDASNSYGEFNYTENGYGPYSWGTGAWMDFYAFSNINYTVNFYFLDGPPNPCSLVLGVAGLAQSTTVNVSQPVTFRTEYDLNYNASNYNRGPSAYTEFNGAYGSALQSGVTGITVGSAYSLSGNQGDDLNTGWACLQPTNNLPITNLAAGSVQGYAGPLNGLPCLSLNVTQLAGDGIGFTVGYICCSNCATNCLQVACPPAKYVQCGASWTFDEPTATTCCTNAIVGTSGLLTNILITPLETTTNGACPKIITQTWLVTDGCGNSNICSQAVTVINTNPPTLVCATNLIVMSGQAWSFTPPAASDSCCSNLFVTVLGTVTNISTTSCSVNYTRTWQVTDCCSNSAVCSQTVSVVPSSPCQVFNTGKNGTNVLPGDAIDPTYTLVSQPAAGLATLPNAVTLYPANAALYSALPNNATSQWIGADPTNAQEPSGVYHYQVNFLLCCTNGAELTGQMAADNSAGVFLNGHFIASVPGFTNWTPVNAFSGFVPGLNTLDIYLTNIGSTPTALRAEITVCDFPFMVYCPTNKAVLCDSGWSFDPPTALSCCGSNISIMPLSTTTNGTCTKVITRTWLVSDGCSNQAVCDQVVTAIPVAPTLVCASNKTVAAGSAWAFDPPVTDNACCTNVTICVLSYETNVSCNPCAIHYTCTWQVTDCCTNTGTCSQTVTAIPTSPCQVFNTGMNESTSLAAGDMDPNFNLVGYPDGALVINPGDLPASYLPDGPNSQWIGPDAYSYYEPYGVYHYQLEFLLCCAHGAELSGRIAADNSATVFLNGAPVGSIADSAGYSSWTAIDVTNGLVTCPSLNVLDVYVTNFYNEYDPYPSSPTAFRAELSACISPFVVDCPSDKTVECGSTWTFDRPTATSCCSNVNIASLGATTNGICPTVITGTWLITDACGDSTTCSQAVTVENTNAPIINCPANIFVQSCSNLPVCYTVTASNACCGTNVTVVCTPPSCSVFASGTTTTVNCLATDCCGNSNVCAFSVTVQGCTPPPTNMVLWLPFDETNGATSGNLAASADYGTQVGSPAPVLGSYVANSLHFNGTTNQYVTVPNYAGIEIGTNDFTIDAWVNRATNGPNSLPSIIVDKRDPKTAVGYSLSLSYGALVLSISGTYVDAGTRVVQPDGLWHFIAVSVSQSTGKMLFYIDGMSNSVAAVTPGSVFNTNPLWVGGSQYGDLNGNDRHWTGDIDELEIYSRALSTNELASIFNAGSCGKCKPCCYLETLYITRYSTTSVELTWAGCGTLQSATAVTGRWTDVPGATSPYIAPIVGTAKFFRLECP